MLVDNADWSWLIAESRRLDSAWRSRQEGDSQSRGNTVPPEYHDFALTLTGKPGDYTLSAYGPGAILVSTVHSPYRETDEWRLHVENIRKGFAPERDTMRVVGETLFNALFPRRIIRAYESASQINGRHLRLRLLILPPELALLPWELLFDPDENHFLTHQLSHPIVRSVQNDRPPEPDLVRHPVRVLFVQANPPGTEPLDAVAGERAVREALPSDAVIDTLRAATKEKLRAALRREPGYSILHYHGHGKFDEVREEGFLFLHDEAGAIDGLSGEELASYVDGTGVRLAVLVGCETARDSSQRRMSGVAHKLMGSGRLPMTVAMQFAIYEGPANAFTREFYRALADSYPVDAAMVEARKAVVEHLGGDPAEAPDWATPVLFMRSPDGRIFAEEEGEAAPVPLPPPGPARQEQTGVEALDWFVDRRKQLDGFVHMLEDEKTKPAMFIQAADGMGKSWLMVQLSEACRKHGVPASLVDLDDGRAGDYRSIVRQMADQLRPSYFRPLGQLLAATSGLDTPRSRGAEQDAAAAVTKAFLDCLRNLIRSVGTVALLFDSFERGTAPAQRWLSEQLLPQVLDPDSRHIITVLAGTRLPELAQDQDQRIARSGLTCFEEKDVREYFERRTLADRIPSLTLSTECKDGSYLPWYIAVQADKAEAQRQAEMDWLYE